MLHALLIAAALTAAAPAATPTSATHTGGRLAQCLAQVDVDAEAAYEEARAWVAQQGGREALFCAAAAELGRGRAERAAAQFEALAGSSPEEERPALYAQAGNAWLIAGAPAQAIGAIDKALALVPKSAELLVDRARARALAGDWRGAEEDLNSALDLSGPEALALALRAETRLRQGAFDLAVYDAEQALKLAPDSVEAALSLGRAREAQRLGQAPD